MTQLVFLLVGAGLTMVAQAVVQLRVVPRVEARKRREDRWERDVLALGEVLSAEVPDRANYAKSAQWIYQTIVHTAADAVADGHSIDQEQRRATESRLSEQADEAVERYRAVADTRISWLTKRVVGLAPQNVGLARFRALHTRYSMASAICTHYTFSFVNFDEETYEQQWRKERELREQLTKAVEALIGNPPPRNPSRLQRAGHRLAERTKALKVKRQQDK